MTIGSGLSPQERALGRIRTLSRVLTVLISIALGMAVLFVMVVVLFLVFFHQFGSPLAFVSFNEWGLGLSIGGTPRSVVGPGFIRVASLGLGQRLTAAGLGALCAGCSALALFQLRGLFALYARGIVFSANNVARIKMFGLWLILAAVVTNLAGRLFVWLLDAPVRGVANTALTVIFGAMIYVIAYVMELGREADLERQDFI